MASVTVTGGTAQPVQSLTYDANDAAYAQAQVLAAAVTSADSGKKAIFYTGGTSVLGNGELIIQTSLASNNIQAQGFSSIIDENNGVTSTVWGGGDVTNQTVLAGDGGLTFQAHTGSTTVVAGGGNNVITFQSDLDAVAAYTSTGNDSISGGDGTTTISAGGGYNTIVSGAGLTTITSTGYDTITLNAAGSDTIMVGTGGSDSVKASIGDYTGSGYQLTFIGGDLASTVAGGSGAVSVFGGAGGGRFGGGSQGSNFIQAGTGAATIIGGGNNDTLLGGAGADSIRAALGNETLAGGDTSEKNVFDLRIGSVSGTTGSSYTITINDFNSNDVMNVGNATAIKLAESSFTVVDGNGFFSLEDGTTVELVGWTTKLTGHNFGN